MIKKFVKGRVYVFIDAENLFYTQRTLGWLVSYDKLMKYFKDECGETTKIFVYTGVDEDNQNEKKFLNMLKAKEFILKTRTVKKIKSGQGRYEWKNNLDMELAFDMAETVDDYDTAVLMSGDSDFSVPITRIKKKGKRIIVMSTRGHISIELLELAKYIDLRKLEDKLKLKDRK